MSAPKRLWADIEEHERVDREFLLGCNGAIKPGWVDRRLAKMQRVDGCAAACPWYSAPHKWKKCSFGVAPGEQFCPLHGGAKFPPPIPKPPKTPQEWTQQKRETLLRRKAKIDEQLTALDMS